MSNQPSKQKRQKYPQEVKDYAISYARQNPNTLKITKELQKKIGVNVPQGTLANWLKKEGISLQNLNRDLQITKNTENVLKEFGTINFE